MSPVVTLQMNKMNRKLNTHLHCTCQKILVHQIEIRNQMKTKRLILTFISTIFNLYLYFWSNLMPEMSHGLQLATMEHSRFLAWNHPTCFRFGVIWGQACPMVCGRLPWNILDLCFLQKHWTTFLTPLPWNDLDSCFYVNIEPNFWHKMTSQKLLFLKQSESRRVPWFAGGYHGTFWIFGLKPIRLFHIWCCLRPGTSHGLRAATMECSGLMLFR